MKIIIGLGNPGEKYNNTRHNIGFRVLDTLREKWDFPGFELSKKLNAKLSKGRGLKEDMLLAKPQTFMNQSGQAVRNILEFYKLAPKDIIVIHDEIDLPLGEYRLAANSSAAGNNGVQSIIDHLKTQEFTRIRIGVANEELRAKIDPGDFVLQKFSQEEKSSIENVLKSIISEIEEIRQK